MVENKGDYASVDEVEAAYVELLNSKPQLVRLKRYADALVFALGDKVLGRDGRELIAEAVKRTLAETRHWKKAIPFYVHLQQTVRSIANSWARSAEPPQVPASRLVRPVGDDAEERGTPYDLAVSGEPPPDRVALAKLQLQRIRNFFADDWKVQLVIDGQLEGRTQSEIEELGLPQKDYEAAWKKLCRNALKALEEKKAANVN